MTVPDLFEPVRATVAGQVPGRARDPLIGGAAVFGPDDDGFMVYVRPEAMAQLRVATLRAAPAEAFGLLLGRTFQDGRGAYTLIADAVEAADRDATPGHVRLSIPQIGQLRRHAQARYPAHDLVGWWHSHHAHDRFSSTDLDEQATWPDPHHIGLLTLMHRGTIARAYRGPHAVPLAPDEPVEPATQVPHDSRPVPKPRALLTRCAAFLNRPAPTWAVLLLAAAVAFCLYAVAAPVS